MFKFRTTPLSKPSSTETWNASNLGHRRQRLRYPSPIRTRLLRPRRTAMDPHDFSPSRKFLNCHTSLLYVVVIRRCHTSLYVVVVRRCHTSLSLSYVGMSSTDLGFVFAPTWIRSSLTTCSDDRSLSEAARQPVPELSSPLGFGKASQPSPMIAHSPKRPHELFRDRFDSSALDLYRPRDSNLLVFPWRPCRFKCGMDLHRHRRHGIEPGESPVVTSLAHLAHFPRWHW